MQDLQSTLGMLSDSMPDLALGESTPFEPYTDPCNTMDIPFFQLEKIIGAPPPSHMSDTIPVLVVVGLFHREPGALNSTRNSQRS
jgi:hypothetical protein